MNEEAAVDDEPGVTAVVWSNLKSLHHIVPFSQAWKGQISCSGRVSIIFRAIFPVKEPKMSVAVKK